MERQLQCHLDELKSLASRYDQQKAQDAFYCSCPGLMEVSAWSNVMVGLMAVCQLNYKSH